MNQQPENLSAAQLAALLFFYADAGVDTLIEDMPVDRFLEVAKEPPRPGAPPASASPPSASRAAERVRQTRDQPAPRPAATNLTIPGDEAVALARKTAENAASLAELAAALAGFEACNLKASAKTTVFPKMAARLPILVLGPAPSAEDDREGEAFSGAHGELLSRMLSAIGIEKEGVTLAHAIAWRPPGGRPPTPAEAEICRPFAERLIAILKPQLIILMGNFAARFLTGAQESIHALRGQWFTIETGGVSTKAIAMLHPQDLITAPLSKRLAWEDLLSFEAEFRRNGG